MLHTNAKESEKELIELCDMFYENDMPEIYHEQMLAGKLYNIITIDVKADEYQYDMPTGSALKQKSLRKRYALLSLYKTLSKRENIVLPWGRFTGILPTALSR